MMKLDYISTYKALAWYASMITSLSGSYCPYYTTILNWIVKFCDKFETRLSKNGKKGTLKRYKSIYNWFKGYLFEAKGYKQLLDPFIRTNTKGFPLEIAPVMGLIDSLSPMGIRVIMTVLRLFESIKLPVEFNPEPIVNDYSGKPLEPILEKFKSFTKQGLLVFGDPIRALLKISLLSATDLRFSFKSGPMGPCILSSHLCAIALVGCPEAMGIFVNYCISTDSYEILKLLNQTYDNCSKDVEKGRQKPITGRIALASEPAGKTRLFAICNFWVQTLLKPLHNQVMKILRLFPSDGTFDQVGQYNRLVDSSKRKKVYCFDLSKATDRFPIALQTIVLGLLVNEAFSENGKRLISGLPFQYKDESFIWKVGQPLGALSSGAMFALTHHFVVQYCYWQVYNKLHGFNGYSLLGDDIAIGDEKVALYYLDFMESIGVEINLAKSVIGISSGEFAKRNFLNGSDISGFGFSMVEKATANPSSGIRFLEVLIQEGFYNDESELLFPVSKGRELSQSFKRQLIGLGTMRQAYAQKLFLVNGNTVYSPKDIMEHYVLQRMQLLYNQMSSSLEERTYRRIKSKIQKISKCGGVEVSSNFLDVSFVNNELVAHPLVRYLNERNNIIFDKIELYNEMLRSGLFSQDTILSFTSYSEEEYIPSFTLDAFFTEDLNGLRNRLKISIQNKAITTLMRSH